MAKKRVFISFDYDNDEILNAFRPDFSDFPMNVVDSGLFLPQAQCIPTLSRDAVL